MSRPLPDFVAASAASAAAALSPCIVQDVPEDRIRSPPRIQRRSRAEMQELRMLTPSSPTRSTAVGVALSDEASAQPQQRRRQPRRKLTLPESELLVPAVSAAQAFEEYRAGAARAVAEMTAEQEQDSDTTESAGSVEQESKSAVPAAKRTKRAPMLKERATQLSDSLAFHCSLGGSKWTIRNMDNDAYVSLIVQIKPVFVNRYGNLTTVAFDVANLGLGISNFVRSVEEREDMVPYLYTRPDGSKCKLINSNSGLMNAKFFLTDKNEEVEVGALYTCDLHLEASEYKGKKSLSASMFNCFKAQRVANAYNSMRLTNARK